DGLFIGQPPAFFALLSQLIEAADHARHGGGGREPTRARCRQRASRLMEFPWSDTPRFRQTPERGVVAARSAEKPQKPSLTHNRLEIPGSHSRTKDSGNKTASNRYRQIEPSNHATLNERAYMSNYISHDHEHDGIDRRGFLKCMAWAGTGVLWTISGGVLVSKTLAEVAKTG